MPRNLLFICSRCKLRSPTAEAIFEGRPGIQTDAGGLSPDAETPLSPEQIAWADVILVMETIHRSRLNRRFGRLLSGKRVGVLNIPDDFDFMDQELVKLLEARCAPYL